MPKPLPDTVLCLRCMETNHKRLKARVPATSSAQVSPGDGLQITKVIGNVELTTFTAFLNHCQFHQL